MSDDDKTVTVPGLSHDNAVLLLEAAQSLNLDPSVVRTNGLGEFEVPAEVAKKAGFDEEGKPSSKDAKDAAPQEDEQPEQSGRRLPEPDSDADPQGADPVKPAKKTAARRGTTKSGE